MNSKQRRARTIARRAKPSPTTNRQDRNLCRAMEGGYPSASHSPSNAIAAFYWVGVGNGLSFGNSGACNSLMRGSMP